jgi:2-C-methyl-D-erythritol 2,4-cyclodiphosphate synthase
MSRVGIGYDSHRLVPGGPLLIGGVEIEFDRGLEGHSDAGRSVVARRSPSHRR